MQLTTLKLKDSIGSRRIVAIYKALDDYVYHEELCLKLDIKIDNLKYFLKKMVKMGIITLVHGRGTNGRFTNTSVTKHLTPYIE